MGNCYNKQPIEFNLQLNDFGQEIFQNLINQTLYVQKIELKSYLIDQDLKIDANRPWDERKPFIFKITTDSSPEYKFNIYQHHGQIIIYYGQVYNKIKQGNGVLLYQDGASYQGQWLYGKPHGFGIFIHSNRDTYEGDFKNGKANGFGVLVQEQGFIQGDFLNDFQNGQGEEVWKDGTRYNGQYFQGFKHGKGKFFWTEKEYYEGDFYMNKIQGHGIYHWPNGERYEGNWLNFQTHGEGKLYKANGDMINVQSHNGQIVSSQKDKQLPQNQQTP